MKNLQHLRTGSQLWSPCLPGSAQTVNKRPLGLLSATRTASLCLLLVVSLFNRPLDTELASVAEHRLCKPHEECMVEKRSAAG